MWIPKKRTVKDRARRLKNDKIYVEKNRIKVRARRLFQYHLDAGNISKPKKCSKCPSILQLEAHHEDYSKPLVVLWLCNKCHVIIHKNK